MDCGGAVGTGQSVLREGTAMLVMASVLSYMVLLMRKQAHYIKSWLEAQVESVPNTGPTFTMALLAFVLVIRESIETVFSLVSARPPGTSSTPMPHRQ
ncbi:MAG: FTR1 family protein [Dehalococcoidia bacterium]|nr:FTR1 family protein [Dehalococcoidia bacterium]